MEIRDASPALGAVVDGLDLRRVPAAADVARLRAVFAERFLLVFPGQDLDDAQHVDAVARFGPVVTEASGTPTFVSNHRADGSLGSSAASFHIDFGFFPSPYEAISLYGLEIPPDGTETWFVNGVLAARTLPVALSARVEGCVARQAVDVRSPAGQAGVRVREGRLDESYPNTLRPVLWPHRTSGEEILGVWEQHTDAILPLEPEASTALIEELFAHLYRPEHTYVHHWAPGDLVVWDNHAIQHGRPAVGTEVPRTLRRVVVGEPQDLSLFAGVRVT